MPSIDVETVVKFVAVNMERESRLLGPSPAIIMHDPYGLLKLVEEAGVDATQIDQWLQEAQLAKQS